MTKDPTPIEQLLKGESDDEVSAQSQELQPPSTINTTTTAIIDGIVRTTTTVTTISSEPVPTEKTIVIPGYIGQPKGLKQVLYERGLYKMNEQLSFPSVPEMKMMLGNHTDFVNEIGILEEIMVLRGHILLMSPKCHPEIAGCGIEYLWGYSKQKFRRRYNDMRAKNLHRNVLLSFNPEELSIERCRHFARLTRDYMRVYKEMAAQKLLRPNMTEQEALENAYKNGEIPIECKASIEKMLLLTKNHHCRPVLAG